MTKKDINEIIKIKEDIGRIKTFNLFSGNTSMTFTENQFCPYDFTMTGNTKGKMYLGEIKAYTDKNNIRPYSKFPNYQIDYSKLEKVEETAKSLNHIPILVVHFSDCTIVWRLDKVDWKSTSKSVLTNDKGYSYGTSKTITKQAFLYKEDGYVYDKV